MSTLDFSRLTQPDLPGMCLPPGGEAGGSYLEPSLVSAWLGQLVAEGVAHYAERKDPKHLPMQSGQAQRAFLRIFGNPADHQLVHFLQGLHRFTESDHPLAAILFRALMALSAEHEDAGDFLGPRAPDASARPRVTALWMRESLARWCDWVDACVHFQTHAQWHLAPEHFNPDATKRALGAQFGQPRAWGQMNRPGQGSWRWRQTLAEEGLRGLPGWPILPQAAISQPQRPWPHPELDETVISLWPLVQRHNWSFTDLLKVLRDLVSSVDVYPCQTERNLATYCINALHLPKAGRGATAQLDRPVGYPVALRLFPPPPPPAAAVLADPSWIPAAGHDTWRFERVGV